MELAYYGDDFTGSTDVLESLALAGIAAELFVTEPVMPAVTPPAIGLAGLSRTFSVAAMETHLPDAFAALAAGQPRFLHYKVCSTFDSSPAIGSIGRAIEIGRRMFPTRWTPLVVAAPRLGRWSAFGNLFARSGLDSPAYRLDRHPTMSRHPVTPMHEADLRLVLAGQTNLPVTLIDLPTVEQGGEAVMAAITLARDGIVLFDATTAAHLATIGHTIDTLQRREGRPLFVAGSSGIEAALLAANAIAADQGGVSVVTAGGAFGPLLVVSGSRSPVTARQIDRALHAGFIDMPITAPHASESANQIVASATTAHREGRSIIVRPGDDDWTEMTGVALGTLLGGVAARIVDAAGFRRVVVAGGDTSGEVARRMGVWSLRFSAPLAAGAPWCRVASVHPAVDGGEYAFKGGQVGKDDFFVMARDAGADSPRICS